MAKRVATLSPLQMNLVAISPQLEKPLQTKIPNSSKNINDYLRAIQRSQNTIFLSPCTDTEVKRLLNNLPNKGSSGTDSISNILLKKLKDVISLPLTMIINASIEQGAFPDLMKCALVVPLYKAKAKDEVTNYRPISLLMTISKIIEKVMYKRVYDYLNMYRTTVRKPVWLPDKSLLRARNWRIIRQYS